jgi:YVTN family beta-propeller protein
MFDDTVSVIDVATREEIRVLPVGDEPHGVLTDSDGKHLYVLNAASDDISVYDAVALEWIKNLSASRRPWSLSRSPDGGSLVVTHALSRFVPFRTTSKTEATLIDTENAVVEDRSVLEGANLLMGVDWHPSGDFALVTLNRTKHLVPMTRLLQGWTITNGLGILWRSGAVDQVLLDESDIAFPDPTDVAITPDGRYALVTSSGSDRVAVVDLEKLTALVRRSSDYEREHVLPNHLGKPTEFVVAHIPTRDSPRGVLVMPNGKTAFVANALDDSLTVIDLERLEAAGRIDLGGPKTITQVRFGERLFHSADIAFHRQFSCHTCHPDGHVDGLTYDIEADGIGMNPVDNRTLRGILDTAPFKWTGKNKTLRRQCGPRLAVFFTRIEPFTPDELAALEHYISTIPRPPNRHRPLGADLTRAQRNGKRMFERTVTNDGRPIPPEGRCITCHFPPYYSDRSIRDAGNQMWLDEGTHFDVPHLNNIYDSAPYLHNGIAHTLEEIWTVYNPHDEHGVTNDMTKDQLNDLIEYLKTL